MNPLLSRIIIDCIICERKKVDRASYTDERLASGSPRSSNSVCNECYFLLNPEDRDYIGENDHLPKHILMAKAVKGWQK